MQRPSLRQSCAWDADSNLGGDLWNPDPRFDNIGAADGSAVINPIADDFKLGSDRPCINTGYSGNGDILIPGFDFFGNERPAGDGYDIGVHEYE